MTKPSTKKSINQDSPFTRQSLHSNYDKVLSTVQAELPPPRRMFSKFIHTRPIERISELLGATIFRPNALLFGAIAAFAVTIITYLVAKNFGYRLSGFESIIGFILGWLVGLIHDYLTAMLSGGKKH